MTGLPALANDPNIVARPTVTLLRDFDPCFDQVEEGESNENEDDEEAIEVEELYDQIDEITISGEVGMDPTPKAKPRKKFPIGSPKKINFGPPKPPRNFNYSATNEESKTKETKELRDIPSRLKTMLSESNLVRAITKSDLEAAVKAAGGEQKAEKELCARQKGTAATENIYVTVPFLPTEKEEEEEEVEEEEVAPPPLPASKPPASKSERSVTMYENVWVEPPAGPPAGPPLPPRAVSGEHPTKTGRLEEIFFNRKVSQESLGSPNSSPGKLRLTVQTCACVPSENMIISDYKFYTPHHQKTESVGSESSGSLYSGI